MKKIFSSILLLVSVLVSLSQRSPESAEEIMKKAYAAAKKDDKKVMVIFHASWCTWCHKMDTSLNDPSVKRYFDNSFVIRHLVVFESRGKESLENPGALEMLSKYNGKEDGIPFWLIFDKDENFLADSRMTTISNGHEKLQNTGCPASKDEVNYFIKVLKRTTSLNEDELEKIRIRFRRNQ
ncbi:MAG TPA: thioredoxin family protein [Chitinophagaceae bacterium]|nr:thioredoxin family protein [Chitinophagaceae bacterium]